MLDLSEFIPQKRQTSPWDPKEYLQKSGIASHEPYTRDIAPIKQPPRRQPFAQDDYLEHVVEEKIDEGGARPNDRPWASLLVLVKKKDGSIRFCVGYRRLNEVMILDTYPLPRIDDCFLCLGNSFWFCTLDLKSGN